MDLNQLKSHAFPIRLTIAGTLGRSQLRTKYDSMADPTAKFKDSAPYYIANIINPMIIPGSCKDANNQNDPLAEQYIQSRFKTVIDGDGNQTTRFYGKSKSNYPIRISYDTRIQGVETFPALSVEDHNTTYGADLEKELASGLKVEMIITIFNSKKATGGFLGCGFESILLQEPIKFYQPSGGLDQYLASQGIQQSAPAPAPQSAPTVQTQAAPAQATANGYTQYQAPQAQAPAYQAPAQQAPAYQAPQTQAPAYQAPAQQAAPVQPQAPAYQAPAQQAQPQAPAYQAPAQQTPAYQAPAQQAQPQAPVQQATTNAGGAPLPGPLNYTPQ